MKKFIALLIIFVGVGLQTANSQILPVDKYIFEYTGVATDTIGATGTTFVKEIQLNKFDGLFYNAKVKVSDYTAGAGCTSVLYGKYFANDTYQAITTYTWYGGGTDTTFVYTANTNKVYYRYLKFVVTRTTSKAKINYIGLSLKK